MIWDTDSYIVHENGPIAVTYPPVTKLAPVDRDYRARVEATYQQMLREQHDRNAAKWKRAHGPKS